ncbi:conserved hypothetical protein [uncultured Mycobacterium sp.]|uniref:DUF1232 domain-containing protein n=1 Tax=uncultured Mycobacterium sp. TaxID=171292 RepID=A0A1Y5PN21_9MYCO|nr:conserved hypothetical protein [uncultured Mycobacterium sp.]
MSVHDWFLDNTKMDGMLDQWWLIPVSIAAALILVWLALAVTLWLVKPDAVGIADMLRLLPDVLRLLKRLASDPQLPRRIRVVVGGMLIFLASPIDLIPDFIPVLGYADDVIITALVLRWVTRTAGPHALAAHWPGTPDGLAALRRLCGLSESV